MGAILTGRGPGYIQTLHRARTAATAPSKNGERLRSDALRGRRIVCNRFLRSKKQKRGGGGELRASAFLEP